MVKRIAVFVEGYTEQEFAIRLIKELVDKQNNVAFEIKEQNEGYLTLINVLSHPNPDIHVLVVNCCNDAQVKSQIKDQFSSLEGAGYSLIIGLRDVYPFKSCEIPDLQTELYTGLPTKANLPIHLHLAVMEIEAWFLEETTHFFSFNNNLTPDVLMGHGFDCNNLRAHTFPHPAKTLDDIYKIVGGGYSKNKYAVQNTIYSLSYEEIYVTTRQRAPSLDGFIISLENGIF